MSQTHDHPQSRKRRTGRRRSHDKAGDDHFAVHARGVNHSFGEGELSKQVLFDNDLDLAKGEIVIMTGPSGSGKTTLLTLIGACARVQEGSLQVLGRELHGALRPAVWSTSAATSALSFRRTICSNRSPRIKTSRWRWS